MVFFWNKCTIQNSCLSSFWCLVEVCQHILSPYSLNLLFLGRSEGLGWKIQRKKNLYFWPGKKLVFFLICTKLYKIFVFFFFFFHMTSGNALFKTSSFWTASLHQSYQFECLRSPCIENTMYWGFLNSKCWVKHYEVDAILTSEPSQDVT